MSIRRSAGVTLAALFVVPLAAAAQTSVVEQAVLPLPESERAGATVMVWENGDLVTAREGEGNFICLADDPSREGFHAACYHRALEPYMARGRELVAQGVDRRASIQQRAREIEEGNLEMPEMGFLHQLFAGPDWTGDPAAATRLTVIYVPFRTPSDLGLPAGRSNGPWMMFPGEGTAHIMISG